MLTVRERPPLRLALDVVSPGGRHSRWGRDEHDPGNVPGNLGFSTTMPGGFEQLSCVLPRKPGFDYPDLAAFSTITCYGAGGEVAWQGRLQTSPRTSGDQVAITPGAVGWQAALEDNKHASMIYVDRDLSRWGAPSTSRQIAIQANNQSLGSTSTASDAGGQPALIQEIDDSWVAPLTPLCEAWYDAGPGNTITRIYYDLVQSVNAGGVAGFVEQVFTASDDIGSLTLPTGNLNSAGEASGYLIPASFYRHAAVQHQYTTTPAGGAGGRWLSTWRNLIVYGNFGLSGRGSDPVGYYASDIIGHAVTTWASSLATTFHGVGTLEQSTFIIPQAAYRDFTTAGAIIQDVLKYEVQDWWVDEGGSNRSPTFNLCSPANHGRDWRARVGPSGLQETGPSVDRLWNQVVVSYHDVDGSTRTVGPVDSGADTIDGSLSDATSTNAVTAAGLKRVYAYPDIGVSTAEGAVKIGQGFLYEQAQKSTAGQAKIVGHVEDDHGVIWPAWAIRAGDRIVFTDAHDPVARKVVRSQYDDASKANQLDLDSPPENLDSLLARYGAALTGLGVG